MVLQGDRARAAIEGRREQAMEPLSPLVNAGLAHTLFLARRYDQACIYAGANDLDRAFEWQAKAYDDGASPFYYFSPLIENLHSDPRHRAELQRMGLLQIE